MVKEIMEGLAVKATAWSLVSLLLRKESGGGVKDLHPCRAVALDEASSLQSTHTTYSDKAQKK